MRRRITLFAQGFVALSFFAGAIMKLALPIHQLSGIWPWTGDLPELAVRALGIVDLAGAIGVIMPALIGWRPAVTLLAGYGCATLQVCAMVFHASRGEFSSLPVNFFLLGASVIIVSAYRQQ